VEGARGWQELSFRGRRRSQTLFLFADGTMSLVKANPEKYEEAGSFKIGDTKRPSWSHPVILDGKLYVRNQDQILCYDIKAK
jgi:hypothetical protein